MADPAGAADGVTGPARNDPSNGYEAVAEEFTARRGPAAIGLATVREWARLLPSGASVLDLGCGDGVPIAEALVGDGFDVYGIEASPTLAAAFARRFPTARVACEPVEESAFFHRTFDGVVAVGLLFLLPADAQRSLVRRVAALLNHGGRFLFTAPAAACTWTDVLTGRESRSLGVVEYRATIEAAGLEMAGEHVDEGGNQYYDFRSA